MQTDHGILFTVPVQIGETLLEGEVLAPVTQIRSVKAPTKKNSHFVLNLDVLIAKEDAPDATDIRWLLPTGELRDIQVLLVFEPNTIRAAEL